MRCAIATIALLVSIGPTRVALAQSAGDGRIPSELAQLKGVICPPAGVDREMQVAPPDGGKLRVIPAPGTPGGDQSVQPK